MPYVTRSASAHLAAASVALLLAAFPLAASAQSLGTLAQSESARRQTKPKPGKVYTNDSLRSDFTASQPAPATPDGAAPAAAPAQAAADPAASSEAASSEKKDEAYWKKRMADARDQLTRTEAFASALESQINGLTVDFLQRDDPAQRATIETNRKKAIAEHERVQREVAAHKKAITAVEDEARKAGVPPGWLR